LTASAIESFTGALGAGGVVEGVIVLAGGVGSGAHPATTIKTSPAAEKDFVRMNLDKQKPQE
jgi:hypothetical protein